VDLNELDAILEDNTMQAQRGAQYWDRLKNETELGDNDCVLLFPSCDKEINFTSLLYLDQLMNIKQFDHAVILSVDKTVMEHAGRFSNRISRIIEISRDDAVCLMRYYALLEFSSRFYICSLQEPEGRLGELLLEKWDFTMDEMVRAGIYRMYGYTAETKGYEEYLK